MRGPELAQSLSDEFPGSRVALIPPENPRMVICEVESSPEKSVAVAYIESMDYHYHNLSDVSLKVESGEISLLVVSKQITLTEGEEHTVQKGKIHSAIGDWAKVRIESKPGWTKEDHTYISRR